MFQNLTLFQNPVELCLFCFINNKQNSYSNYKYKYVGIASELTIRHNLNYKAQLKLLMDEMK